MSREQALNGYYAYFNSGVGNILSNAASQALAFDSGQLIGNALAGPWSTTVALSNDDVLNPGLNKGGLAGKGIGILL